MIFELFKRYENCDTNEILINHPNRKQKNEKIHNRKFIKAKVINFKLFKTKLRINNITVFQQKSQLLINILVEIREKNPIMKKKKIIRDHYMRYPGSQESPRLHTNLGG